MQLPENVSFHLMSMKAADINVLILRKFGIKGPKAVLYYELIKKLFLKSIRVADLPVAAVKLFALSEQQALSFACDVAGSRLLVLKDWINEDVPALITSWGGEVAKYAPHVDAQIRGKAEEERYIAEQLKEPELPPIAGANQNEGVVPGELTPEQQLEAVRAVFREKIATVFQLTDEMSVRAVNEDIMDLLTDKDLEMINELIGLMFANTEQLTAERIVLDGQLVEPTIGHWLELFVRVKGAAIFDTVAMMDFVTNNDNTKNLSASERDWIIKLLTLYRNLKFFPGSQPSNDPATWQIFPLPEDGEEAPLPGRSSDKQGQPVSAAAQFLAPMASVAPAPLNYSSSSRPSASAMPAAPAVSDISASEALRLQKLLEQFPAGSLERLAIEEELKKYQ